MAYEYSEYDIVYEYSVQCIRYSVRLHCMSTVWCIVYEYRV
jgi:hypothetical protein